MQPVENLPLVAIIAAALYVGLCLADGVPTKENPVLAGDDDEVKNLPGLNDAVNFRHFSGYLQADSSAKPSKFFHYWFVESESNPATDPILLWLNGGPGCSSMAGLFTELGPFRVKDDGKTLEKNEFSWNKVANVLFLESPAGVGYSYSNNWVNVHTDDTTAHENYRALKSFMKKFPQYKSNPLYLSGESYGGVYLPTLGVLVDKDSELNLKGVAIGNGYLDAGKLMDSLIFFSYYHGLVGKSTWDKLSNDCCGGRAPSREACQFDDAYSGTSCGRVVEDISTIINLSGLNRYNLYAKCAQPDAKSFNQELVLNPNYISRETIDKSLQSVPMTNKTGKPFHLLDTRDGVEPPCVDDSNLIKYLNDEQVRAAIHVPKELGRWSTCARLIYGMQYPNRPGGLAPQMKSLISSERKLTMLVYNGDVDMACNFLGDEWFVDDLGRAVLSKYQAWKVDNQIAGFVKHYDGITFATIRGSGHMVPGDRPKEALAMIKRFLSSKNSNVEL